MKTAITTLGVIGIILAVVLSIGSIYVMGHPFPRPLAILGDKENVVQFSEIQKKLMEDALREDALFHQREKSILSSQASYARYGLFLFLSHV